MVSYAKMRRDLAAFRLYLWRWTVSAISRMNGAVSMISASGFRDALPRGWDPPGAGDETLRIGLQTTGTFAWQLDVIRRHGLAGSAGLDLKISEFASPMRASSPSIAVRSISPSSIGFGWPGRARWAPNSVLSLFQRGWRRHGEGRLRGAPDRRPQGPGSCRGGRAARQELADRPGRGDPRRHRPQTRDHARIWRAAADAQKLQQGEAAASLNFWNFCARLEAMGYRRILDVRDAEAALGLNQPVALIGYVFSEQFVSEPPAHHRPLHRRDAKGQRVMLRSDQEWEALRPLMKAEDEATFKAYRDRTREGMPRRPIVRKKPMPGRCSAARFGRRPGAAGAVAPA